MKHFKRSLAFGALLLLTVCAHAQSTSAVRAHADSVQRSLLHDSLGLSSSVTTQFLALRDSNTVRSERVQANTSLTPHQRNEQMQSVRRDIIIAMRELIGALNYDRYLELLSAQ